MHILSPETDNCPSWISGRERMTVENISWPISTKECCRPWRGLNPRPPGLQSDGASNWATEAGSAVWSGPSLSTHRIFRYYRMYEWRAKIQMTLCACAGRYASTHSVQVCKQCFASNSPYETYSITIVKTRNVFVKHYAPKYSTKAGKGRNSLIWFLFSKLIGDLLIINSFTATSDRNRLLQTA